MTKLVHKKVFFQNEIFWLHQIKEGFKMYHISPLDHYNEKDDITLAAINQTAYAELVEDKIFRHGKVVGTFSDLIDISNAKE